MDIDEISKILEANKNKSFVKRILYPNKYPTLKNKDGSFSTHSMAWMAAGNKYVVFPTVLYDGKKLIRYTPKDAWEHVRKTGNYIEFDNPFKADSFSREYKKYWKRSIK